MRRVANPFAVCLFLLITIMPLPALAADSDGDGVDDSMDAFPTKPEATTDTDGDGKPNAIDISKLAGVTWESFESGLFSGSWSQAGAGNPWTVVSDAAAHGVYSARINSSGTFGFPQARYLQRTVTVGAGATVSFSVMGTFNGDTSILRFYVDGAQIKQWLLPVYAWTAQSFALTAGTHTLKWQMNANSTGTYAKIDAICAGSCQSTLTEDTDDDNDGAVDTLDTFPLDPAESADADNDSIGNNADLDDDNDGLPDYIDADPLNAGNANERSLDLNAGFKGSALREVVSP